MAIKFSIEQEEALRFEKGNTLVSASAGSGKTAVLTERVFRIIKSNVRLSELLVLTFTNLAAQEMRDRIRKKLLDDKLYDMAANVDAVSIQTYDAFALSLVKKYGDKINVYGQIKVVDKALIDLQIKKTIRQILDKHYDNNDIDIIALAYDYCFKNDDNLVEFIINTYNKIDNLTDKEQFLNNYLSSFYDENKISSFVDEYYEKYRKYLNDSIKQLKFFDNTKYVDMMLPFLENIEKLDTLEKLHVYLENYSFPRKTKNADEEISSFHASLKNNLNTYFAHLNYSNKDEIVSRILSDKKNVSTFIKLLNELDENVYIFKKDHGVYTFLDIFKMAMKIVNIPSIKEKLKKQYKYIMIDEYQDTSPLQEEFIKTFASDNLYCVGDVKQSIYRFRNADCALFQHKFDEYKNGRDGKLITLFDNYRSRDEVIGDNNYIFSNLMNLENTGLDYSSDHAMKFAKKDYSSLIEKGANYHHEILYFNMEDKTKVRAEYEANIICSDIINKIKNHVQVREGDNLRDITYSDFAILSYAKTEFAIFQKVFSEYSIPLYANYEQSLNDNDVTLTFKNIIKCIACYLDNKLDKTFDHSFISILRSFLFEIKDQEIENFYFNKNRDDFPAFSLIKNIASKVKNHSLLEITKMIIIDFDFYEKLIKVGDISSNKELINYFYNVADMMDALNYSLNDYSSYYEDLKQFDIEQTFKGSDSNIDSVNLLTIHASKGLEFKYIYYVGLTKIFRFSEGGTKLGFDKDFGFDLYSRKSGDSYFHDFILKKERLAMVNEQLRVFYVALTRAREKAILLLNQNKYEKAKVKDSFSKINSYADFLKFGKIELPTRNIAFTSERLRKAYSDILNTIKIVDGYEFNKEVYSPIRISKKKSEDASSEALELGNKFHYYLELVDFSNKDVSFIKDEKDRKIIVNFLKNDLFKFASNAEICHEYAFYDELEDVNGVIDLLLIYSDHIDIIDYKLSNIDDEAYARQLRLYKNYISKISDKKINMYIISILNGNVREVK